VISTFAKLLRANEHLQSVNTDVDKIVAKLNPYPVSVDLDEQPGWCALWADPVSFGPETTHLPMVIGDVIHNLRSALDHLVWDLIRVSTKKNPRGKPQFPICTDPTDFACCSRTMLRGVLPEYRTVIEEAQPYYGGKAPDESPLRWLNILSNIDKHRQFVVTAGTLDGADLHFPGGTPEGLKIIPGILDGRTKIARYRCPDGIAAMDMHSDVTISIVFGNRGVVRGKTITETLDQIGVAVGQVANRFLTDLEISSDDFPGGSPLATQ
jgi:hypothetical protein